MIFIENKYTTIYYNIVNRAKLRNLDGYCEKHHIIPKSLGGSNAKDNLVKLTAKEHFICHLLLTRMTISVSKSKMVQALCMMMDMHSGNQSRYIPSSTLYERARKYRAELMSLNTGTKNPMFGKKHSETTRAKLREAAKYKPKQSREVIEKVRQLNLGQKRSDETKQRLSLAWKHKAKFKCVHCGLVCAAHTHNRWHGNNCKVMRDLDNKILHDSTTDLPSS